MLESLFNKVARVLSSHDLSEVFKNTYFPIIRQNQTTLPCKQISKAT